MPELAHRLLGLIDRAVERGSRAAALRCGRRSLLARAGGAFLATSLLPVLPFQRGAEAATAVGQGDPMDELSCDYWRYCSLDGNLCNTTGGTTTTCPVGSEASKVSWVGTCNNPADGKAYLISYNDCCGKASYSGATFCLRSEGERPGYRMGLYNDINWCMANANLGYHCTVALLVGLADEG